MADAVNMKQIREFINGRLYELRPDRYTKSERVLSNADAVDTEDEFADTTADDEQPDNDWMEPIYDEVSKRLPEKQARKVLAERLVRDMEGQKTQGANRLLRKIREEGQYMLGWLDLNREPVAITTRQPKWGGKVLLREERVALCKLNRDDLLAFELNERRRAAKEAKVRNDTCDAVQWILEQMVATGAVVLGDWMRVDEVHTGT